MDNPTKPASGDFVRFHNGRQSGRVWRVKEDGETAQLVTSEGRPVEVPVADLEYAGLGYLKFSELEGN